MNIASICCCIFKNISSILTEDEMFQLRQTWDSCLLHTPVGLIETPVVTCNNKI